MSDNHEHSVLTAFLVVVPQDGVCYTLTDIPDNFEISKTATQADIRRGCRDVVDDLNAQAAAQYVAGLLEPAKTPTNAEKIAQALNDRRQEGD